MGWLDRCDEINLHCWTKDEVSGVKKVVECQPSFILTAPSLVLNLTREGDYNIMPDENSERLAMAILIGNLKEKEELNLELIQKSESPDFLIKIKEDIIGVDVTDFSTQGNRFESNSFLDKALKCGKQIFRDNGGPALNVSVHFSNQPRNCQAEDIGECLARVVQIMLEDNVTDTSAYSRDDLFALFSEHGLLDYVFAIGFCSVDEEAELWKSPGAAWEILVSVEEVQKVVDKKNKKLAGYRKNCNNVWLAIHNRLEAGFYTISDEAKQFSYTHGFDRIFWIEMRGGNPISLNDPILPAIKENMPKSRTDVFRVYEFR